MSQSNPKRWTRLRVVIVVALALFAGALLFVLVQDLRREPREQWTARSLVAAIDLYQFGLSGRVERLGVRCRFEPTCSHYAKAVIVKHGALLGISKTSLRLLRCGPWTAPETIDPP